MKRFIVIAAMLLLPVAAGAQTFNVDLEGDTGTGFATIQISGDMIDYSILTSGLTSPTEAIITDGDVTIDLGASFNAGSAVGETTSADAPAVAELLQEDTGRPVLQISAVTGRGLPDLVGGPNQVQVSASMTGL